MVLSTEDSNNVVYTICDPGTLNAALLGEYQIFEFIIQCNKQDFLHIFIRRRLLFNSSISVKY